MDEKSALERCCQAQDPVAFEFFVKKYRREAYFHAYGFLGNEDDAKEACQEAFTKAYVAIPRLTHIRAFYPWFYRILKNLCLNSIKRRSLEKSKLKVQARSHIRTETEPSQGLEQEEQKTQVWAVLKQLKPEFREILVLKHFQSLSYQEISKRLNIPRGTVMSRLFHARKRFQELFKLLDSVQESESTDAL